MLLFDVHDYDTSASNHRSARYEPIPLVLRFCYPTRAPAWALLGQGDVPVELVGPLWQHLRNLFDIFVSSTGKTLWRALDKENMPTESLERTMTMLASLGKVLAIWMVPQTA